ncbi:MFS transporter [Eisenbergiella sp.]
MNSNKSRKNYAKDGNIYRNIPLDYIFTFLKNLDMSTSVWVLYLAFKGMNLWQIGILEGVYHITSMICEIPSGAAADLLGRKRTVVWGRLCTAVSCILMLLSGKFWGFALSFVIQALGNNLNSGSEEALVYDSMKQCGREPEYLKVNGRINLLIEISQSIATVTGGILAERSYVWCYGASVIIALLALLPAVLMKEPDIVQEEAQEETNPQGKKNPQETGKCGGMIKQHFVTSFRILAENREIRRILLYFETVFAFYTVLFFYSQQYFYDMGLNKVEISVIMLLGGLASCLGALASEKVYGKAGEMTQYAAALVIAAGLAGFFLQRLSVSVVLFVAACFANALLYPIQSISLNRLIPSGQRATLISVGSMLFSIIMVLLFPAAGAAAERIGLSGAFLLLGVLQLVMTVLFYRDSHRQK